MSLKTTQNFGDRLDHLKMYGVRSSPVPPSISGSPHIISLISSEIERITSILQGLSIFTLYGHSISFSPLSRDPDIKDIFQVFLS